MIIGIVNIGISLDKLSVTITAEQQACERDSAIVVIHTMYQLEFLSDQALSVFLLSVHISKAIGRLGNVT